MPEEETQEETTENVQEAETDVEAQEETPKKKKVKKVVRRRKTKKERENPLTTSIRLAVENGKVEFGARTGIVASVLGNAKLFVVAQNTPKEFMVKLDAQSKSSNIPIIQFEGNTMELGSVCGKPFPVSVLSIYEQGSSNILDLVKKQ